MVSTRPPTCKSSSLFNSPLVTVPNAPIVIIIIIIIIIIYFLWEFFTPTLADGFSLEFEWKRVSSGLQDFSQYSGRSQQ